MNTARARSSTSSFRRSRFRAAAQFDRRGRAPGVRNGALNSARLAKPMSFENPEIPDGINVSEKHPLRDFASLLLAVVALSALLAAAAALGAGYLARHVPFRFETGARRPLSAFGTAGLGAAALSAADCRSAGGRRTVASGHANSSALLGTSRGQRVRHARRQRGRIPWSAGESAQRERGRHGARARDRAREASSSDRVSGTRHRDRRGARERFVFCRPFGCRRRHARRRFAHAAHVYAGPGERRGRDCARSPGGRYTGMRAAQPICSRRCKEWKPNRPRRYPRCCSLIRI